MTSAAKAAYIRKAFAIWQRGQDAFTALSDMNAPRPMETLFAIPNAVDELDALTPPVPYLRLHSDLRAALTDADEATLIALEGHRPAQRQAERVDAHKALRIVGTELVRLASKLDNDGE